MASSIRLVIVERVIAIMDENLNFAFDEFTQPMANSWFLLTDPNVMYDFHFYWPMINHQTNWGMCGGTTSYPAPSVLEETFSGQPRVSETYSLCLYDGDTLIDQIVVPADAASWKDWKARGFSYQDRSGSQDGTIKIGLKAGSAGSPKPVTVVWNGKGAGLPDPTLPLSTPVDVTAQVVSSNGECFSSTFGSAVRNGTSPSGKWRRFKAQTR